MKKKVGQFFLILLLTFTFGLNVESSLSILPVSQIKAGMKGKGKSVFMGGKIEEFDVEILGVLHNFQPKRNLILAKLKNSILDEAGVIQGMSGSPVYVDGKLIGAVAYSFGTFTKEAIAGITPIAEMLAISEGDTSKSSFSPRIPIKKHLTLEELFEINKEFFQARSAGAAEGQIFKPLSIPLVFSGFSSPVFEKAKTFFSKLGFIPLRAGSSAQSLDEVSPPDMTLQEGAPVGVQLIGGDMNMSAVGTVTYVDGSRILAFGHPLYNLGAVDYAMTKAKVIAVIPSLSTSVKVAVTDIIVGRFSQDRTSGVLGELGKMPKFIPINFKLLNAKGKIRDFKVKISNDKILTPALVNLAVTNIMSIEERSYGDLTIELNGNVYLDNGMSIHLEDLFSGTLNSSIVNLSSLVSAVVFFLTNNEFEELAIHRIDLNFRVAEEVRFSYLEKVWLDKYDVSPGEKIQIKIYSRNFRGESMLKEVSLAAPHLQSGSEFYIVIGDAASIHQIETKQYRTQAFVPRSLNQLVRILSSLRKNNRIYFKILAAKPGLFLKGEEMPNLPPTMKSMFSSPRVASSVPTELNRSTLGEYQIPINYVFKGAALIPIKIK